MRTVLQLMLIGVAAALVMGCATVTRVTSESTGASVLLDGNYKGQTPLSLSVPDKLDPNSTWTIAVEKLGYETEVKIFREQWPQGVGQVIPTEVHFILKPTSKDVPK